MNNSDEQRAAERECYHEAVCLGVLPPRLWSGSLTNTFRASAVQTLRRLVTVKFGGDFARAAVAMRAERQGRDDVTQRAAAVLERAGSG